MSKKIFRSIIAVAMIVLLASLVISSTFLYDYFNKLQVSQLKEELSLAAANVNSGQIEYFDHLDSSVFRFTLVSADGEVLYDSQAAADDMENHLAREEIAEALKSGSGSSARYSSTLTERTFYEATRLENGNVLRISVSQATVGIVILCFDVTEAAFAERNRREFTANVSHELKTPLQSIIGSAELLENGLVKPEDVGRFVGNIKKEAAGLVLLINDIIRLSQLDENTEAVSESVDLYEIVKEGIEALSPSAAKKQVTLRLNGRPCRMNGVRRYLYEIIYNLCDNAIRYNKIGGTVTIELRQSDGTVILSVSDTGIGIPTEHHSRIFERFYRVDKSHSKETGGTGLGLSIVKHAVAYHGGTIKLDSKLGEGTTITVEF